MADYKQPILRENGFITAVEQEDGTLTDGKFEVNALQETECLWCGKKTDQGKWCSGVCWDKAMKGRPPTSKHEYVLRLDGEVNKDDDWAEFKNVNLETVTEGQMFSNGDKVYRCVAITTVRATAGMTHGSRRDVTTVSIVEDKELTAANRKASNAPCSHGFSNRKWCGVCRRG